MRWFVLAVLFAAAAGGGTSPGSAAQNPAPLLIVLGGEFEQWQAEASRRGWLLASPHAELLAAPGDELAKGIEKIIADVSERIAVDPARVYLAGAGPLTPAVFYVRGRMPHLWAAAAALGGSPKAAIDSNRLFAANVRLVPMLWTREADDGSADRLRAAGYPVTVRTQSEAGLAGAFDFLAPHRRDPEPETVDCETGSLAFLRCYWVEITKVDPALRNDAVPVTRVPPGSGASLALGRFGFDPSQPGPGLVVSGLPKGYQGPLHAGDRILAVGGKPVGSAQDYLRLMDGIREEKAVAVTIGRGKRILRLETRTVLPKRAENVTVRVRASWSPDTRELLMMTRGVAALRFQLSAGRAPARVNWNGREMGEADRTGCWEVDGGLLPCR